jgi:integrase/recombinase XerD
MKYFPDIKVAVPLVELINLSAVEQTEKVEKVEKPTSPQVDCQFDDSNYSCLVGRLLTETDDSRLLLVKEFLQLDSLEANSRRLYERDLRRFLQWSDLDFAEMTATLLSNYRTWLETAPTIRTGKPLARNSINAAITALKSFFGWLSTTYPQQCPHNPTDQIKRLKGQPTTPQPLSTEALAYLWQTLPTLGQTHYRDTILVHLLIQGLRASEVAALNLANFDGAALLVPGTKTQPSRLVTLNPNSIAALNQYLDWRKEHLNQSLTPDAPLVISLHVAHLGKRLSYIGIYQAIERLGKIASQRCTAESLDSPDQVQRILHELANLHPDQLRQTNSSNLFINSN